MTATTPMPTDRTSGIGDRGIGSTSTHGPLIGLPVAEAGHRHQRAQRDEGKTEAGAGPRRL